MNKFLADSFSSVVSIGSTILWIIVFCAGIAAMVQSMWMGLAIIICGSIIVVSAFGALAVILSLYEEVKTIRKQLEDSRLNP